MKPRHAGIYLLLSLTVPVLMTYGYLCHQKWIVKNQVKQSIIAGLDRDELVFLKFSRDDQSKLLKWEHSREFEYQDQMYDVVYVVETTDSLSYWCWWDHEETALNLQLKSLVKKLWSQTPISKDSNLKLIEFYDKLFLASPKAITHSTIRTQKGFIRPSRCYDSYCEFPSVPPPQLS